MRASRRRVFVDQLKNVHRTPRIRGVGTVAAGRGKEELELDVDIWNRNKVAVEG